jgi:enoyl-CoA hydratase/carnithine racemase
MVSNLKYVTCKQEGRIAWIRFNRPEKLNALNLELLRDLESGVAWCEEDSSVGVLVLIGDKKAFVSGGDIDHMAKADIAVAYDLTDLTTRVQERLADLPKPTIAAISGYALGGGLEMSLCCDFRIATDTAVLGLPEITLGIIPGGGGTQRLPRLVGLGPAYRLILLGERIGSQEAASLGLVDKIVHSDHLEDEARALASKLLEQPPLALRAAKTAIRKGMNSSLKDGLQMEQDLFCMLFATQDQKEGMSAFLEKRKPDFKGR